MQEREKEMSAFRGKHLHFTAGTIKTQWETPAVGQAQSQRFVPPRTGSGNLGTLSECKTQTMTTGHDDGLPPRLLQFESFINL